MLASLKCLIRLYKNWHQEVSFVKARGVPGSQGATTRAWQHAYSEAAMQRTTMKVLGNVQDGLTISRILIRSGQSAGASGGPPLIFTVQASCFFVLQGSKRASRLTHSRLSRSELITSAKVMSTAMASRAATAPVRGQVHQRSAAPLAKSSLAAAVAKLSATTSRPRLAAAKLSVRRAKHAQRLCIAAAGGGTTVVSAASADARAPKQFKWGADMKTLGISVAIACVVWVLPPPAGVTVQARPACNFCTIVLATSSSVFV